MVGKKATNPEHNFGHYNFPDDEVVWEKATNGVVPNPAGGNSPKSRCFSNISLITEESLEMEQLVSKPTRGDNILDLVYTNVPEAFGPCKVSNLQPLSDHDWYDENKFNSPEQVSLLKQQAS